MPGGAQKAARRIVCPNCRHRVEQGRRECSYCGIGLSGGYTIRASAAYAVRSNSRLDPRLFLLILVIGLASLMVSRGLPLAQALLTQLDRFLRRAL